MNDKTADVVGIRPFSEVQGDVLARKQIEDIFFAASATQSFPDAAARTAFKQRWLGRYLDWFPAEAFVAVTGGSLVVGYLVGSLADPAEDPRFADIGFFQSFRGETARFPAQLHVNLAAAARNQGIGGRLITAFCNHARAKGVCGVHVVTSATSRNRSFYARQGFEPRASLSTGLGGEIVLLGRRL